MTHVDMLPDHMIQGVFFNWRSPKINKYGEKLKYQNWCPPKRYQFCWHLILDILVVDNGGYYVPVVATGGFSDAPGSIYRSILSSCSYCWKIFTTGASYLTTGTLCNGEPPTLPSASKSNKTLNTGLYLPIFWGRYT